jgi:hypothetical protein
VDYRALVQRIAIEEGVDPVLAVRVMRAESRGDPNAVSSAGARGLMQLMPGTARDMGVTDINDPIQNIRAGVRYLKQQLGAFGSVPVALAAYNAGPNAVREHGGVPPYPETREYIRRIMGTDPRMAGSMDNAGMSVPAIDPRQLPGRSDEMPPDPNMMPGMPGMPGMNGMPMMQQQPMSPAQTLLQRMAGNPLLQMGLGILSETGPNAGANVARGIQQGMAASMMALQSQAKFDLALQEQAYSLEEARQKRRTMLEARVTADAIQDPVMRTLFLRNPQAYATLAAQQGQSTGMSQAALTMTGGMPGGGAYPDGGGAYTGDGYLPAGAGVPMPGDQGMGQPQAPMAPMPGDQGMGQPQAPMPGGQGMGQPPMPPEGPQMPAGAPGPQGTPMGQPRASDSLREQARVLAEQSQQAGGEAGIELAKRAMDLQQRADEMDVQEQMQIDKERRDMQSPQSLRDAYDEVEKRLGPFKETWKAASQVNDFLDQGSPLAITSAIQTFQRIIDPGVSVRESDIELIRGATSLFDRIKSIASTVKGDTLTPAQVTAMRDIVSRLSKINEALAQSTYDALHQKYSRFGYNLGEIGLNWKPGPPIGDRPSGANPKIRSITPLKD